MMTDRITIDDDDVVRMAEELAKAYDGDIVAALHVALRNALSTRDEERERKRREIEAIATRFQSHIPSESKGMTSREMMDAIYDEGGLPT